MPTAIETNYGIAKIDELEPAPRIAPPETPDDGRKRFDVRRTLVGRVECPDDERAEPVVAHQHVPDTEHTNLHNAFTLAISFPSTSTVWTAQARHGSNERTVRINSSGSFASATGLPTSDASYGPG